MQMSGSCSDMKHHSLNENMGRACRSCLNEKFGVDLKPRDCSYSIYPGQCRICGEMKNIVQEIKWRKRIFLRFK